LAVRVTAFRLPRPGLRVWRFSKGQPYPPNSFPLNGRWGAPGTSGSEQRLVWVVPPRGPSRYRAVSRVGLGGCSLSLRQRDPRKDEKCFVKEDLDRVAQDTGPVTQQHLIPPVTTALIDVERPEVPLALSPRDRNSTALALGEAIGLTASRVDSPQSRRQLQVAPAATPTIRGRRQSSRRGGRARCGGATQHQWRRSTTCRCRRVRPGCNASARDTTLVTPSSPKRYYPRRIRTLGESRRANRADGGFRLDYLQHDLQREGTSSLPGSCQPRRSPARLKSSPPARWHAVSCFSRTARVSVT